MSKTPRKLFAVMPFGVKAEIDFDLVYSELIRPAGNAAGWAVLRIDDIAVPGAISDQYLREIFDADMVVADVSISNANVFYELGIRHAISTGGTLLLALKGTPLPFDIAHLWVLFYELDSSGLLKARKRLEQTLLDYRPNQTLTSNPIRQFLEKLGAVSNPASNIIAFEQELYGRISRGRNLEQLVAVWRWAQNLEPLPALALLSLAERLSEFEAWQISVEVLRTALITQPTDFEIHRQLGWHLRHLGPAYEEEAITSLKHALELNPGDPESLGMLGGVYKRQRKYDEAAECYNRGVKLSPESLYMRVNQAALVILSTPQSTDEGVALYKKLYEDTTRDWKLRSDEWAELVCGEAAFAIGNDAEAEEHFRRAVSLDTPARALRSACDQLQLLASVGFRSVEANRLAALLGQLAKPASISITQPSGAEAEPKHEAETPVILHLSDIHFGSKDKDGKPINMHRFYDGEYEKSLSNHLISEFKSRKAHFVHNQNRLHLIVSGDLTYTAEEAEFKLVSAFLKEVCSGLGIPKKRVILVPGNHDVHWPSTEIDSSRRFDNYLSFLRSFYGKALFRERYPLVKWNFAIDTPRPEPSDLIAISSINGMTIIGLNSCVYETNQNHYGYVGGRQLDKVDQKLDEIGGHAGDLRIAVLHHHLHPFPEPVSKLDGQEVWIDMSTIRDAGLVERRLERLGFDLVLHGHKHKPQLRETLVHDNDVLTKQGSRLIVCGAGSTGVNGKELEHNQSNHYQVIETLRIPRTSGADFLSIEWRELSLIPGSNWMTSQRWKIPG